MAASASDKLRKSYSFLQKSLNGNITDSDTTITLNNTTSIPTDTAVDFIIDRVDSNGNRTNSTREIVSGVVSGSTIINCTRGLHGTTAQSHTSGAVVEFVASGKAWNDLITHLLVEHNQDGTHGAVTATSVATDTITEDTAAAGVTIDGLQIKDSKLVTADSVVEANITDGIIANAHLKTGAGEPGGAWTSWTPTWTNFTPGSATIEAKYKQIGKTVHFHLQVTLSGSTVSGLIGFSPPVDASTTYSKNEDCITTNVSLVDAGAALNFGMCLWTSASRFSIYAAAASSSYVSRASTSSTVPHTWGNTDYFIVSGSYEAA